MALHLFGTSGWSYTEWVGPFYDKSERMFSYYSNFFKTVEIDSTFYRYPTKSQIYGYFRTSPKDFIFSAKLPKILTHEKKLSLELTVKNDLFRFLELMEPLYRAGKLGAILIQLPPSFVYKRDHENLAGFLEALPTGYEFAVEFRDRSWLRDDVWKLLSDHNVAYTVVDEPLLPSEVHITADFSYIRWHGRGSRPWYDYHYSREELQVWIPEIQQIDDKVRKVYGYFNNHYHGYAPENCIEILEMLNQALPEQSRIKEKIIQHNLQKRPLAYDRKLEEFGLGLSDLDVRDLLLKMTDEARIERGSEIPNEEVSIEESTDEHISATIREYTIDIDLDGKAVVHNCDDWKKGLSTKRICKHLCKLFLAMPKEESTRILKSIIEEKENWTLKYE